MDDYFETPAPNFHLFSRNFSQTRKSTEDSINKTMVTTPPFNPLHKDSVIHSIGEQTAGGSILEAILDLYRLSTYLIVSKASPSPTPCGGISRSYSTLLIPYCFAPLLVILLSCRPVDLAIPNKELLEVSSTISLCPDLAKWRDNIEAALWGFHNGKSSAGIIK